MEVALGLESTVMSELKLVNHVDAMTYIHRPRTVEEVGMARERLAFEELLLLQVGKLRVRPGRPDVARRVVQRILIPRFSTLAAS